MDAWSALRGHPARFLRSRWPWRSLAYLLTSLLVGIPLVVLLLALVRQLGTLERRRLGLVQSRPASALTRRERRQARRRLPMSWPEVGYAFLLAVVLFPLDFLVLVFLVTVPVTLVLAPVLAETGDLVMLGWHVDPGSEAWLAALVGVALCVVAAYALTLAAVAQGALARLLLDPREAQLVAEVANLRRSRVDLVDAFETERRRIERDLHDGVQQRLVALTMTLGRAELDVPDGPGLVAVQDAHRQAEEALADLRSTIRGIHPRVLVDHGLAAAVHELADRSPVPVSVDITLAERLPAPVEQAAYFVVSEALTNVARHSRARRAGVHGWVRDSTFVLTVDDDGVGGATAAGAGTGLAGLAVRLDALGGTLRVTSPPGGPTEVRMECPV
ncbi:MAG TPA: sensor domain-containing protein [Nocardioides sp.]|uniref:sensor histidine kinase n=1 Tax=Nocardioides sp. TaxID=35761 RepID=UPI002E2F6B48|nr:sensor domain-containing protein [Nocardioides sp.]HEX5090767.1 sensor domain-containing protein [Nocardioides sp.]